MKAFPFIFAVCFSAVVAAQSSGTNAVLVSPSLINELADEASTNNAAIKAARARVRAAEVNEQSIPLFKDPELMVGGMIADRMMREEDGDVMIGVEQDLPLFGKVQASRKVAKVETSVEGAALVYEFQSLRKELAERLFEAALADELLEIAERDLDWLRTTADIVEHQFENGSATQVDLLRIQNERSKRVELLKNERNMREEAYVTVNRILFRNLGWPWPKMRLPEVGPEVKFNDRLMEIANRFEPKIKVMKREVELARAMSSLAHVERRPEVMAGVQNRTYSRVPDNRSTEIYLKMSVPLFNRTKYKSAEKREAARAEAAEWMLEDYSKEVRQEVHHLTTRIDNARREALVFRDEIIPRSRQALNAAEASWNQGQGMLREVLDMRRMLLDAETMYFKAVAEQWRAMSDLVLCCGLGDLEALINFDFSKNTQPDEENNESR